MSILVAVAKQCLRLEQYLKSNLATAALNRARYVQDNAADMVRIAGVNLTAQLTTASAKHRTAVAALEKQLQDDNTKAYARHSIDCEDADKEHALAAALGQTASGLHIQASKAGSALVALQ